MKFVIFNGSPRREKSNSKVLTDHFLEGYQQDKNSLDVAVHYIADLKQRALHCQAFREAEVVLIIFPLYTDSMPAVVKLFFEQIATLQAVSHKKLGFILQSGFPEAVHALSLEPYLAKLAARLHCHYLGTITKGGVEGIQMMPPMMTRKLFDGFKSLGVYFARNHAFDPQILQAFRHPYRMSRTKQAFMYLLAYTGLTNFYWNSHLKRNNAYPQRFARPYKQDPDTRNLQSFC